MSSLSLVNHVYVCVSATTPSFVLHLFLDWFSLADSGDTYYDNIAVALSEGILSKEVGWVILLLKTFVICCCCCFFFLIFLFDVQCNAVQTFFCFC